MQNDTIDDQQANAYIDEHYDTNQMVSCTLRKDGYSETEIDNQSTGGCEGSLRQKLLLQHFSVKPLIVNENSANAVLCLCSSQTGS